MLYNVVSVSAVHQRESATCMHMSRLPALQAVTEHPGLSAVCDTANPAGWLFYAQYVCVSMLLCPSVAPSPPSLCPQVCSLVCISVAALQIDSSVPSF